MSSRRDQRGDKNFDGVPSSGGSPIDEDSIPVNLRAVRADDEFIEALLSRPVVPARTPVDYELAALLSNWRSDILAEPMPTSPTLEDIEAGIERQRRAESRQRSIRLVRFTAGAAAGFAILFGGISVVAHNAAPGDALWGVKEVMFGADASATQAVADVQAGIDGAEQALASGDKPAATTFLIRAQSRLDDVPDSGERKDLQAKIDGLWGEAGTATSVTTPPETITNKPGQTGTSDPLTEGPTVTVTVPQETVTITPGETSTSEPAPSTEPSEPTVVREPPADDPTSSSSSVPVPPA